MNKTLRIKTLITAYAAVLLTAVSSSAGIAIVDFTWSQSDPDPSTGSGMLSTTVAGVDFSAPMPIPTFTQKDTLLGGESFPTTGPGGEGVVGFANTTGNDGGFYLGWSGTVDLTGSRDGTDFTFPVELSYEEGDTRSWAATVFDDPVGATDVNQAGEIRWAGWIGDDGDGHRHTGDGDQVYGVGQDIFTTGSAGDLDENGWGDNVGISMGVRELPSGSIFLADLVFGGSLQQDENGVFPPLILPGDVNEDGKVDMDDFEPIRLNFGQDVAARADGDLNDDLFVNFVDFIEFKSAFLAGGGSLAAIQWVPEPSTGVLLLIFTAICTLRRPHARSTPI